MNKAIAINGSPRKHRGNTAMVLNPLIEGMESAGCQVEVVYAKDLKVQSCYCPDMYCWYTKPETCCIHDDMDQLYPRLREAEIFILATPVYIPLPGEMQNIVNRLCPLLLPSLVQRDGRTRGRFHDSVKIKKVLLVSSGGWWEEGNFEIVTKIVSELAENASVEFSGAVIRPHAFLMQNEDGITEDGKKIIDAARQAGEELVREGKISQDKLDIIKRPLISESDLRAMYNSWLNR